MMEQVGEERLRRHKHNKNRHTFSFILNKMGEGPLNIMRWNQNGPYSLLEQTKQNKTLSKKAPGKRFVINTFEDVSIGLRLKISTRGGTHSILYSSKNRVLFNIQESISLPVSFRAQLWFYFVVSLPKKIR